MQNPEVKFYASKKKAFGYLMLTFALVSMCLFNLYNKHNDFITWASLIFFSLGIPIFIYGIFNDKPLLILTETGVYGNGTNKKTINWDTISDAYLHKVNKQTFICLVMKNGESPYEQKSMFTKDLMEYNKLFFGVEDVNLNISNLNCDAKQLLLLILNMIQSSSGNEKTKVLNAYLTSDLRHQ